MLQFFNSPFYGQTDLTQSELIFLFFQLRVSYFLCLESLITYDLSHCNSTPEHTYPHSSVVCKLLKNWVAGATRGAHYTDRFCCVNLFFFGLICYNPLLPSTPAEAARGGGL